MVSCLKKTASGAATGVMSGLKTVALCVGAIFKSFNPRRHRRHIHVENTSEEMSLPQVPTTDEPVAQDKTIVKRAESK